MSQEPAPEMAPATLSMPDTPIGPLLLAADGGSLTRILFSPKEQAPTTTGSTILARARDQLEEYFAGTRLEFNLPLGPHGTPFQQEVWSALTTIPYGRTRTYGELARQLGTPTGPRAVGAANGQNPLPVVIPCHRVIGADGSLVGYGGGLDRKRALLDLETRAARLL